jgi:hypothetical protein
MSALRDESEFVMGQCSIEDPKRSSQRFSMGPGVVLSEFRDMPPST